MKRYLLLGLMFLLLPITGAAHSAALPVSAVVSTLLVHEVLANVEKPTFLINKIVHGQPINVRVEGTHYTPDKQHDYEQYVQRLYNTWFTSTAQIIEESGRTEFNDLLPLLRRPVAIRFVTWEEEQENEDLVDIRFSFETRKEVIRDCGGSSGVRGCVAMREKPIQVYVPEKVDFQGEKLNATHLHEVGHTLGLLDQRIIAGYTKFLDLPIIEHPWDADVNYAGKEVKGSVMDGMSHPSHMTGVAPDDADALILAVDLCLRNFNRGGETGWKSLNPKSELYYVHGKIGNSPHSFMLVEEEKILINYDEEGNLLGAREVLVGKVRFVRYDEKGQPTVTEFPFAPTGIEVFEEPKVTEVLASDALGRPIVEKGPDGQTIYTAYFYESIDRLVVDKYNQVLRYETTLFESAKFKKAVRKKVLANEYGEFIRLDGYFSHTPHKGAVYSNEHYLLSCTNKECAPGKHSEESKTPEIVLLYKKLKSWFEGRGKAQRVECDSLECQRAMLKKIGERIEELKRNL